MLLVAVLRVLCCASVRGCSIPSVQDADFSETRRKFSCQLMYGPRVSPTMVDAIRVGAVAERMFMRGIKHRQ